MADFALIAQPREHAHRFFDGNGGINAVQLVEINTLDAKITQATRDSATEMRLAVIGPRAGILRRRMPARTIGRSSPDPKPLSIWRQLVSPLRWRRSIQEHSSLGNDQNWMRLGVAGRSNRLRWLAHHAFGVLL